MVLPCAIIPGFGPIEHKGKECMPHKVSRVPSAEQLTELLQAILPFMNLNRYTWEATWRQEDYALPLFVRLTDVLRPIRLRIDSIKGWPPRIESALRIVIESFDATAAAWGWGRVVEPERVAYINERKNWFLETVERPVYEAALSMEAGFRGLKRFRDVDDLADKGRDLGFKATMTPDEGEAHYPLARERWDKAPRLGSCYPTIGKQEEDKLIGAYNLIDSTLKTVKPPTDGRRLDERYEPPKAPATLPDLVTLDQAAGWVNRTARGLRHYRNRGMPKPFIQGTKGKPNEYLWSEMRPWLENTFDRKIPDVAIRQFRTS